MLPILLTCLIGMVKRECLLMLKAGRGGGQEEIILAMHKGDIVRREVKLPTFQDFRAKAI